MTSTQDVVDLITEILEDSNSSKSLKAKLQSIIAMLNTDEELSMKLNKASHALDDLASNSDLDSFTRTQLLGIVSALETVDE
ncbi:MAG TPA: UPF0147 family protein [Candidatus Nanoarchaeia archaeon]|nr:UPF0147 family protein [Candidatus Nanoarchaeia archaeon]